MTTTVAAVLTAAALMTGGPALLPVATPTVGIEAQQQDPAPTPENPLDLNTATVEQLQQIPGIGPALASRIVAFRDEHGAFEKVDDLLNVRGIGVRSLERIRPYLTVKKLLSRAA